MFRNWEKTALIYLKQSFKGRETLDQPLYIKLDFYFPNRKAGDLSNYIEGPNDALTTARVIKDDRLIQVIEARKHFYCENVGTKIVLKTIE